MGSEMCIRDRLVEKASPALYNLACAYVGFEAGVAFNDFVENYNRVVTVEDLLVKGKIKKTKDFGINEHSAMVEKLQAKKVFNEVLPQKQLQNLAGYFVTLPSEVAMKLWTVMGEKHALSQNSVNLHKCRVNGETVAQYFVKILA